MKGSAARPAPHQLGSQEHRVGGIRPAPEPLGVPQHQSPETGHVLLELAVDEVAPVTSEIAIGTGWMMRVPVFGKEVLRIVLRCGQGTGSHEAVVVRVAEDELAGGGVLAAEALHLRLRDPVAEAEGLLLVFRPIALLRPTPRSRRRRRRARSGPARASGAPRARPRSPRVARRWHARPRSEVPPTSQCPDGSPRRPRAPASAARSSCRRGTPPGTFRAWRRRGRGPAGRRG